MTVASEHVSYEYITISYAGASASGKTNRYAVYSVRGGHPLGEIRWHGRWRQYAFFPEALTIYSAGCLQDIASFIEEIR